MVRTLKEIRNLPWGGDISMELMWIFDIDYVTWNNRSS